MIWLLLTLALAQEAPTPEQTPTDAPAAPASKRTFTLKGVVRERGTREPVADQNVFVLPHKLKATTNAQGRFEVPNVPEGDFTWIVNRAGYRKLEQADISNEAEAGDDRVLSIEKNSYLVYETTVVGKGEKRDDTRRGLKRSEFLTLAGSGGDPLKAIQNLPGVNRGLPFTAQVIIQGSAPNDTRYQIDGHEVPIIFHFGGLSSVVLPESLDSVDYLSAGYGPEFGRAMGGIVGVTTKSPDKKAFHGFGFVDIFNAGAMVEAPIGKTGSFLFGGRTSYVGAVLGAATPASANVDFSVAPSFSDLLAIYDVDITHRDHFKLTAVGSLDTLSLLREQVVGRDPNFRFNNSTAFFRLIPQLTHRHSNRTVSKLSFGFGRDWIIVDVSSQYFRLFNWSLTTRGDIERKMFDWWTGAVGFDHRYAWADVSTKLFSSGTGGGGVEREANLTGVKSHQIGVYLRNEFRPWGEDSPLTLIPTGRLDYFPVVNDVVLQPRLAVRYVPTESWLVRMAGGLYAQPPQEVERSEQFGNPNIKAPRAWHLSAGVEKDFRSGGTQGFTAMLGGFYRNFQQLVIPSSTLVERNGVRVPENYNNNGGGQAFGGESLVKFGFGPVDGWLSYTLSRSTRWDPDRAEYIFRFDQTHILAALVGWNIGDNWRLGARFRFVTGNPATPLTEGYYDADFNEYEPTFGTRNSIRLEPFWQLDVRLDKKFVFRDWILSFYLDLQNATNRANVEAVQWAYDHTASANVTGIPILPILGVKAEF
jgi:hypothetical protein